MGTPTDTGGSIQDRLELALAEYMLRIDSGESIDQQQFIDRYPDIADDLHDHFERERAIGAAIAADDTRTSASTSIADDQDQAVDAGPPRKFGDYEILEEIARGGMGVVYKARQVTADRDVALKMILSGSLASPQAIERFYTEARAAANLKHPNIVGVHEVGKIDGLHFYSMDYIEGQDLDDLIREGTLFNQAIARFIRRIASAIHYAHEQGVLHRDLKPSNVLVDEQGEPQITDFGLAKRTDADSDLTGTDQDMGTPSYMSPEQARGASKTVGPPSDVYSLGALMYALLTGRPPFRAETPAETVVQVINEDPVLPSKLNPTVPKDLETICLKCLEKEPAQRYASARDLEEDLGRFQRGEPIKAKPMNRPARVWRWCRRNPVLAGLSAATITTLFAGILVSSAFAVVASNNAWLAEERAHELGDANLKLANSTEDLQLANQNLSEALDDVRQQKIRAERENEVANIRLYASQIARAQTEWKNGDVAAAWLHLNGCRRDLRGWEHDYLFTLFNANQTTLRGHTGAITSVAYSPDGRLIVSASEDGTIKIWDVSTGRETLTLRGHSSHVVNATFSPDGSRILSGGPGDVGQIKVWDASTGQLLFAIRESRTDVTDVTYSPDGRRVASCGVNDDKSTRITVWDVTTGKRILRLKGFPDKSDMVTDVAFSPDGRQIAGSCWDTIIVWDALSGRKIRTLKDRRAEIASIAFSPDGQSIVAAGAENLSLRDNGPVRIRMWDVVTGKETRTLKGHSGGMSTVVFAPDGDRVISCGAEDGLVKVWDATTGQEIGTLKGHAGSVCGAAVSPDGQRIVSGSKDRTIKIWEVSPGSETLMELRRQVRNLALSPDGRRVLSGDAVWDTSDGKRICKLAGAMGDVYNAAFSPDSRRIATGGRWKVEPFKAGEVKLWDASSGQQILALTGPIGLVFGVAFSPNGRRIVSGGREYGPNSKPGEIVVWDALTGENINELKGHTKEVNSVVFTPSGQRIVSGSRDKTVRVWDAVSGKEIFKLSGHGEGVTCVDVGPKGRRIVSGSRDKAIKVWDAVSGEEMFTLRGHTAAVTSVGFSPDGMRIVSCAWDKTIKIWHAVRGEEVLTIYGHTDKVIKVSFSADGRSIFSGSWDGTVKVWNASSIPSSRM